ncbi:uncharacterized protein LOC127735690 [Mytilus californianus]|uniref:uncharacterized protein LOC127735690 n=1 Tax=Mytilus californianus TaxID=6549 RepID=UPI002245D8C8|nr:uncharacterized protein LOC127735690 [Mytilus californianus]
MKELIISIITFQIIFFIAEADSQKLNSLPRHYEEKLLRKIKLSASPEETTIIEKFNNLKDFYPNGGRNHVLLKRNAVQAMMDADGAGSVTRRRKTKRRRRQPPDGLLRAKELQANYIKTDSMRADRLQADMIKADMIKAQDIVVTAKKPRRKPRWRPSFGEFNSVDPVIGIQRINSLTDHPNFDQNLTDLFNKNEFNQFERLSTEPKAMSQKPSLFDSLFSQQQNIADNSQFSQQQSIADDSQLFQQQSIADNSQLFKQQNIADFSPDQRTKIKNKRRLSQFNTPSSFQQTEVLPEFSSSHILNKIPKLSEFIADGTPFVQTQNNPNFKQQDTFLRGAPPPLSSSAFDEYTHIDAQNIGKGENTDQTLDSTVKTYMKESKGTGPWYF